MTPYNPDQPLVSLHIPKTAGSSLRLALEQRFRFGKMKLHYQDFRTLRPPVRHDFRGPICIHGHFDASFGFGVDNYYPEAQQFVAFLREPFERVVSLYCFLRKHHRECRAAGDFVSFEDWIVSLEAARAAGSDISYCCYFPSARNVDAIKKEMSTRFVFIGVTERFGPSLAALAKVLGKRNLVEHYVNRTERNGQDFAKWRSHHEKTFPDDYELYETALGLNEQLLTTFRS